MKIIRLSILAFFLMFLAHQTNAQPCYPCPPTFYCPNCAGGGNCFDDSECVPEDDPGGPIGDAVPLDGASTILLLVGAGIVGSRRITDYFKFIK